MWHAWERRGVECAQGFGGKARKRQLERPRRRREDGIRMNLGKIGSGV
jgi:hypothetical protein